MEEDRISQLPDAILQQILSLIHINQAVQTTILSTRRKHLCFSLSDLHFHLSAFAAAPTRSRSRTRAILHDREAAQALTHRFTRFISHFLSQRDDDAAVRNFHLSIDNSLVHADHTSIEKFMRYAVNHGVQSLRLHASCSPELMPHDTVFASKTLRELELRQFGGVTYLPEQFCFPHLKTLYLEGYTFLYDCELYTISKEPFSGFPELEKLTLRRCMVSGIVVKAPKLTFLEITVETLYSDSVIILEEISAPLLTWFRYEGNFPFECSKVNLPMLEEVYLDIHERLNEERMFLKCVRMLQQLGNATTVALTLDTIKVLEMGGGLIEQSPCPFPYLKCLKLMKGRRPWVIGTVPQSVMNYLTVGSLCFESLMVMEFNQENWDEDLFDDESDDELQLHMLFGIEDERF